MLFKRYISLLLSTSIFIQSVSPTFAMYDDVDKVQKNFSKLKQYTSTPAPLNFASHPKKTSASALHWAKKNGEVYILLGKRDDSKDDVIGEWCNFGGKSDAADNDAEETSEGRIVEGLTNTADREVCEESNDIYAHHPSLLRKQPFIALYSPDKKDGLLHYMYWQQVQYLERKIFMDKLEAATGHNKEYTDFMWIKASLLHQAVEAKTPLLDVEGKKIEIFGPLFSSLSTEAGKNFLHELATHKTIRRFNKDVRPLCNRLYIEKNQEGTIPGKTIAVHWELSKNKPHPTPAVPFGENAFGKDYSQRQVMGPNGEILSEDIVFFNKTKEEDTFAEAVAAHSMAMVELKRRYSAAKTTNDDSFSKDDLKAALEADYKTPDDCREPKTKEYSPKLRTAEIRADLANITAMINKNKAKKDVQSNTVVTPTEEIPQWNPHCEEILSRIHLRIILGKEYKTPEDFKTANNPQRAADLANIKAYFATYNDAEYGQKGNEFKREIKLLDSDYDFFADVLEWEAQNRQWPTFVHGASAKQNNMFKSFTYMRELTDLRPFEDLMALRGTDIYFKNDKTVWDMLNRTGDIEDIETSRAMLFMNFVLLAGLKTTNSTSSSAEYVLNDHSVNEQNIVERFEEALALAGFSKPKYAYFQSIFEQYVEHKHPTAGNSVLIAIAQNPKNLDNYVYPTRCGHFYTGENGQEIKSTLQVLGGIQNEFERQKKDGTEPFTLNSEKKTVLFPEARLFLHPDQVMDPAQTKIKAFDRFPLSAEESAAHDREMRRTTVAIMADWLAQKTKVTPGSFSTYPALKKLYKLAYEGSSGSTLEETNAIDGFLHLIRQGHLDGIKNYLDVYPGILQQDALKNKEILKATFESDNTEIIDFFVKDTLKSDINTLFDPQELMTLLRTLRAEFNDQKGYLDTAIKYVSENYDFTQIDENIKLSLMKRDSLSWAPYFSLSPLFKKLIQNKPHLFTKALDEFFSAGKLSSDLIQKLNNLNLIPPQELLVKFCDHILNGDLKESHQIHNQLLKLLDLNADITVNHPQTGEPMAFLLLRMHFPFNNTLLLKLRVIPSLFDLKNKEGLTLIQCLQKSDLEGRPLTGLAGDFVNFMYNSSSGLYPPYNVYFGRPSNNSCPPFDNPLRFKVNRDWADKLQQATTYSDGCTLISHCPQSDLIGLFEEKLAHLSPYDLFKNKTRNFYDYLSSKKSDNKIWIDKFNLLLVDKNGDDLLDHIKKMPERDEYLYHGGAMNLRDRLKPLEFTQFRPYNLVQKESKWVRDLKKLNEKTILNVEEVRAHLEQIPNPAALRKGLEHLMKDAYAELFPEILKVLYADVEEFLMDEKTVLETGSLADMHPIYYALEKGSPKVAQQMMKFLGEENLQKFLKGSTNEEFSTILRDVPVETIECLFKAAPSLFIHQDAQRDFFFISLTHLPMKLREKLLISNLNQLKLNEKNQNFLPYFFLLFKDEKNIGMIKKLIDKDPSLLKLQSEDYIGIPQMIELLPNNKMRQLLKARY